MKTAPLRAGFLLCLSLPTCRGTDGGAGWSGTIDTSASGVIRVANGGQGVWDSASAWRLEEEIRIAAADTGPASFNQIVALAVDRAGRLHVAEYRPPDLRVFNPDGSFLRRIGRDGSGPGEYRNVSAMFWDSAGRLLVVDQNGGRYSTFDSAGVFVSAAPRLVAANFVVMPWPGMLLDDGRMVDVTLKPGTESFENILVAGRPGTPGNDTIALPAYEQMVYRHQEGGSQMQAGVPFSPNLVWRLDPRGHLWSATTDRYRIVQQRLGGDTVRVIDLEYQPQPVTGAERDTAVAQLEWFRRQGGQTDPSRIPSVKPAFGSLMVDDAGYLWTTPSQPAGVRRGLFDVFDPGGRYLGRVEVPCRGSNVLIRGSRLHAVCHDEDGVPSIVRFRIRGRA